MLLIFIVQLRYVKNIKKKRHECLSKTCKPSFNRGMSFTLSSIRLHAPREVILEIYNTNTLSKKEKVRKIGCKQKITKIVFFGQTIDVSHIKH